MTGPRVIWWKVGAISLIGWASVEGQVLAAEHLKSLMSYLTAAALLATAVVGRGTRMACPADIAINRWPSTLATTAASCVVLAVAIGDTSVVVVLPVLLAAACAEEIVFRDDLLSAVQHDRAVEHLSNGGRYLTAIVVSQVAFAAAHLPTHLANGWPSSNSLPSPTARLTMTFLFGLLMAGLRWAGGGTTLRAVYHTAMNVVSLAMPLSFGMQVTRLLGVTLALSIALASVNYCHGILRKRRGDVRGLSNRAASPLDLPSTPSPARETAPPAGHR